MISSTKIRIFAAIFFIVVIITIQMASVEAKGGSSSRAGGSARAGGGRVGPVYAVPTYHIFNRHRNSSSTGSRPSLALIAVALLSIAFFVSGRTGSYESSEETKRRSDAAQNSGEKKHVCDFGR